jgi:hypothetical protein
MTPTMTRREMVDHDQQTAALYAQAGRLQDALDHHRDRMHQMVGDRKSWVGRQQYWKMTAAQVLDQLRALVAEGDTFSPRHGLKPSEAISREGEKMSAVAAVVLQIEELENTYRKSPWPRYILCLSHDGHVHSYHGCSTLRPTSRLEWHPELSGMTEAEAVAELDEALCSVCFRSAPVALREDYVSRRSQADKAEREAAAVARMAARAAKTLTTAEQFRARNGETVRTVDHLKRLVRGAVEQRVELEWWQSPETSRPGWEPEQIARRIASMTGDLMHAEQDAEHAAQLLIAREREHAGWGADEAGIARMRASKERSARKEWAAA